VIGGPRSLLRRARALLRGPATDPFEVLGLDAAAHLTDDDVRAAWRRIAMASHPDRADGGDPKRFALAAAAYTELRSGDHRRDARAAARPAGKRRLARVLPQWRPVRLAARIATAAAAAAIAVLVARHGPAGPALATGAATWLVVTSWPDLRQLAQPGSGPVATGRDGSADQADHDPT
jgi:DnaJ domain